MKNTTTITFVAKSITLDSNDYQTLHVSLEADMKDVVEEMSCEDRLHEIEPVDIVETVGATKLLNAMAETQFEEWVKNHGDYYEALNAIGIERIREWIDTYTGGE